MNPGLGRQWQLLLRACSNEELHPLAEKLFSILGSAHMRDVGILGFSLVGIIAIRLFRLRRLVIFTLDLAQFTLEARGT